MWIILSSTTIATGIPPEISLLRRLAGVLHETHSERATLWRDTAGEEFAVILPQTDLQKRHEAVAERLRAGGRGFPIRVRDKITISVGAAEYRTWTLAMRCTSQIKRIAP